MKFKPWTFVKPKRGYANEVFNPFGSSEIRKNGNEQLLIRLKVVRDPCQKITLLLLKSKSVRVIVPESCF